MGEVKFGKIFSIGRVRTCRQEEMPGGVTRQKMPWVNEMPQDVEQ